MDTNSSIGTGHAAGGDPAARRLTRRMDQKLIGGVAAGLGDYFGVDPVWFRLGFVITAFFGGAGIVAYLLLWLIVPAATGPSPGAKHPGLVAAGLARRLDRSPAWVGVALLVLGGLLLTNQIVEWRPGVIWGIALIAVGVVLFRRREQGTFTDAPGPSGPEPGPPVATPPLGPPPAAPSTGPMSAWEGPSDLADRTEQSSAVSEPTAPVPEPATPVSEPIAPPGERSRLGWMAVGATLLVLGVAALLDLSNAAEITLGQYLALVLAVLGLALMAGAWWGRARWLVVPAVLLAPFVMVASLIEVPFTGGFGDRSFQPASFDQILPEYRMIGGQMVIDLRETELGIQPISILATDVAGRILVLVPDGVPLEVRARVGAGQVSLFGQVYDGVGIDVQRDFGGQAPGRPGVLRLDLETSLGQVEVDSIPGPGEPRVEVNP